MFFFPPFLPEFIVLPSSPSTILLIILTAYWTWVLANIMLSSWWCPVQAPNISFQFQLDFSVFFVGPMEAFYFGTDKLKAFFISELIQHWKCTNARLAKLWIKARAVVFEFHGSNIEVVVHLISFVKRKCNYQTGSELNQTFRWSVKVKPNLL